MRTIYLQSFFSEPKAHPFSVCRWQPKGYSYVEIDILKPYTAGGTEIKGISPDKYLEAYCEVLRRNYTLIAKMLDSLTADITLCCWCNTERQAKKGYNQLFCHTILIGYFIEAIRPDIKVEYMDGRDNPIWTKHQFKECMRKVIALNIERG